MKDFQIRQTRFSNLIFSVALLLAMSAAGSGCGGQNTSTSTGSVLLASGSGKLSPTPLNTQDYQQFPIDVSRYSSGTIIVKIQMGPGDCTGSFDLFAPGAVIPTTGRPDNSLSGSYDNEGGTATQLSCHFTSPGKYTFCADGGWYAPTGSTNTFQYKAYYESN